MSIPAPADFYSTIDEAPQQGDILLASVTRVVAGDDFAPPRWTILDEARATLLPERSLTSGVILPTLRVAGGRALVMVTTHDCGLDKEFNAVVADLMTRDENPLSEQHAMTTAEKRIELDRSFQVSPLLHPTTVDMAGKLVDQGNLMSGRIVGYLPVPELVVGGTTIIPASVADLNYRTTLDRLAYPQRLSCVSEATRERLRYALARLDVLRTPTLEAQLSAALGQAVVKAKVHQKNPMVVQLTLEDATVLELLKKPGSPEPGPVGRTRGSVPK